MTQNGRYGIYLGVRDGKEVFYRGQRHVNLFGPNGSGKMHTIAGTLARIWRSMFVLDPKGELLAVTGARRAKMGKVVVFNPAHLHVEFLPDAKSSGLNLLERMDAEEDGAAETSVAIANCFSYEDDKKHFAKSARSLVAALIHAVAASHKYPSLPAVCDLLGLPYSVKDDDKTAALSRKLQEIATEKGEEPPGPRSISQFLHQLRRQTTIPELAAAAARYLEPGEELQGVLATAREQLMPLTLSRKMRRHLLHDDGFNFASMKDELTTVYVILPGSELFLSSWYLRLLVTMFLRAMMATPGTGKAGRVILLADEAAALRYFQPLEENIAMVRGYGLSIFLIWQDLEQLISNYRHRWTSFLANSGALGLFGTMDLRTQRHFSSLIGQTTKPDWSYSEAKETGEWRPSVSGKGFPLFMPQDLMSLPPRQVLWLCEGLAGPFRTHIPNYTDAPFYRDEDGEPLRDNPYHSTE